LEDLGLTREDVPGQVWRAAGCESCNRLGYAGRMGIYEFMTATDAVKRLVMANADAGTVKKAAITEGMTTLRDDGIAKVLAGLTSFDEVMRVTQEDSAEVE